MSSRVFKILLGALVCLPTGAPAARADFSGELRTHLKSSNPLKWSCAAVMSRWISPIDLGPDKSFLEFKKNPKEFYLNLKKRAESEGSKFKVPEQAHFLTWVENDIHTKESYLTKRYGREHPWTRGYLGELSELLSNLEQIRRDGIPYFDLIEFVFNHYIEVNDRLIRDFLPAFLSKELTYFHTEYGPTRVDVLRRAFPDVLLFFTADDMASYDFNDIRGVPIRIIGVTPVPVYADRFPLSNGEFSFHDGGHGWAQYVVDQRAARRYNKTFSEAVEIFADYAAAFRERRDQLRTQNYDLWKAANEIAFEIVHRRNFSFDPYFFLHQSGIDIWMKEILWKLDNRWYSVPPLNAKQVTLLPQALDWVHQTARELTEAWTQNLLKKSGAFEKPIPLLITSDGVLGIGTRPQVVMDDVDRHYVSFESPKGELRADLWEISLLNLEKSKPEKLGLDRRMQLARIFALKRGGHAFIVTGESGRFALDQAVIKPDASIALKMTLRSQLGKSSTQRSIIVPIEKVKIPLSDSTLMLREIDNYDHFKMELMLSKSNQDNLYEFFSRPKERVLNGRILKIFQDSKKRWIAHIESAGAPATEIPLSQLTPFELWNPAELDLSPR